MSFPSKRSISVLIRQGDLILLLRRPDDEPELPGIWGLPAGSFRPGESLDDLVGRIGRDKLGVSLRPIRKLSEGIQRRPAYRLEMELWEASMEGTPVTGEWMWSGAGALREGFTSGSLCCQLGLEALREPL